MGKLLRHRTGDKVFFDRGPVDMLAYSIYAWEEKQTDLDEGFLRSLDGVRPTDDGYRKRVDAHFKSLYKRLELRIPILEIQGTRQERIAAIASDIGREPG
jgi:hypothetical protein